MVFSAYFITWLHSVPNSFTYLTKGPLPETIEHTRELLQYPELCDNGVVPTYTVTVLVSCRSELQLTVTTRVVGKSGIDDQFRVCAGTEHVRLFGNRVHVNSHSSNTQAERRSCDESKCH